MSDDIATPSEIHPTKFGNVVANSIPGCANRNLEANARDINSSAEQDSGKPIHLKEAEPSPPTKSVAEEEFLGRHCLLRYPCAMSGHSCAVGRGVSGTSPDRARASGAKRTTAAFLQRMAASAVLSKRAFGTLNPRQF